MIGAKAGQRIAVIGASHAALAAELALVTGLNGTTTVIDGAETSEFVASAAAKAGALLEFHAAPPTLLPVDNETVDLVVLTRRVNVTAVIDHAKVIEEAFRILRPGGRLIAVEGTLKTSRFAWRSPTPASAPLTELQPALSTAGFRAVRLLAEAEGLTYVEGVKTRRAIHHGGQ